MCVMQEEECVIHQYDANPTAIQQAVQAVLASPTFVRRQEEHAVSLA
jgi:hypothetical protein